MHCKILVLILMGRDISWIVPSSEPKYPDEREFITLITQCQGALRGFVSSLMSGHPDTMDIVQETNLLLWEKREDFESGTNFKAWAFRIARFLVLNHRRKFDNRPKLEFDELHVERIGTFWQEEDFLEDESRRTALKDCLGKLRPTDRELVTVRYSDDRSLDDLAKKLGRSKASLYTTLGRLRATLRICIERKLQTTVS